jgi:hypothetical protein
MREVGGRDRRAWRKVGEGGEETAQVAQFSRLMKKDVAAALRRHRALQ